MNLLPEKAKRAPESSLNLRSLVGRRYNQWSLKHSLNETKLLAEFKLTRNRDAWFVIRGYKYQVDLSILRWLSINVGQSLVLEFGEDIDIVNNALSSMIARELEQIKHIDTPITLRTPSSRTALANAVSQNRSEIARVQCIFSKREPYLRKTISFCDAKDFKERNKGA